MKHRRDHEPPLVLEKYGWQYHHMGIPTDEIHPDERYIPHLKMYVWGFDRSPFGIEWMRFEADSPVHGLVQEVPHVAFRVADLEKALEGFDVITEPTEPSASIRVAMIQHNGAPVELMEFK